MNEKNKLLNEVTEKQKKNILNSNPTLLMVEALTIVKRRHVTVHKVTVHFKADCGEFISEVKVMTPPHSCYFNDVKLGRRADGAFQCIFDYELTATSKRVTSGVVKLGKGAEVVGTRKKRKVIKKVEVEKVENKEVKLVEAKDDTDKYLVIDNTKAVENKPTADTATNNTVNEGGVTNGVDLVNANVSASEQPLQNHVGSVPIFSGETDDGATLYRNISNESDTKNDSEIKKESEIKNDSEEKKESEIKYKHIKQYDDSDPQF